ncbi:MAG: hypothetical protein K2L96_04055 [Muribaculaceae bacterium]|nr:hypothetical protein [Muribaculaceae bacterium]
MVACSFTFEIGPEIRSAAPDYTLLAIELDIDNGPTSDALWEEIRACAQDVAARYKMEEIRLRPAIDTTRRAYKALGKEPNRYRPSAEALSRRAVKGMELYRTLTAIDLINLISLRTGISIGGFDADRISGRRLVYGRGRADEPYDAIGRGPLNIEGLPVWRDDMGGIGTPTSDNERTKLSEATVHLLMTVNIYHPATDEEIRTLADEIIAAFRTHASARNPRISVIEQ